MQSPLLTSLVCLIITNRNRSRDAEHYTADRNKQPRTALSLLQFPHACKHRGAHGSVALLPSHARSKTACSHASSPAFHMSHACGSHLNTHACYTEPCVLLTAVHCHVCTHASICACVHAHACRTCIKGFPLLLGYLPCMLIYRFKEGVPPLHTTLLLAVCCQCCLRPPLTAKHCMPAGALGRTSARRMFCSIQPLSGRKPTLYALGKCMEVSRRRWAKIRARRKVAKTTVLEGSKPPALRALLMHRPPTFGRHVNWTSDCAGRVT